MENHVDELMRYTTEILYGIFSEPISEKEYELIKSIMFEYFTITSNDGNAFTGLATFNTYLQRLLSLLMDGYAEENKNM